MQTRGIVSECALLCEPVMSDMDMDNETEHNAVTRRTEDGGARVGRKVGTLGRPGGRLLQTRRAGQTERVDPCRRPLEINGSLLNITGGGEDRRRDVLGHRLFATVDQGAI